MVERIAQETKISGTMNISAEQHIAGEPAAAAFFTVFGNPFLRKIAVKTIGTMFYQFFFRQYRAALFPGRVPVTPVDHDLDAKIPFAPSWGAVYLDFVAFWIRALSFLFRAYGRRIYQKAGDFIETMGLLYAFAAEVYKKNFSTTRRPFYIARPRFLLIHMVDPHLMCVPSLHVMVVIRTYTKFRAIVRDMGDEIRFAPQIAELKNGALAISEAILFVKQHSVNCIAAAMYAMTCFMEDLFPEEEAEDFCSRLFVQSLPPDDGELVRRHIISLYREFLSGRDPSKNWGNPLINFLRRRWTAD
ncbi:MAG: hypothetical protein LBK27_05285 [Treponema sp.]|nr:hypothetical protein [Treponema sp.]